MEQSERRVIGSLLLLSGITFLIVGLYTNQLMMVVQIVKEPLIPEEGIAPSIVKPKPPSAEEKEIAVDAFEYEFNPSSLTVTKGDRIKITIRNTGTVTHSFVIDEFNVSSGNIGPGESTVVEFTVDKSGTFTYYCSIPGHRELGMEGHIIIQT